MLWGLRGSGSGESRLTSSVRRFLSTYILHLNTWCPSSWSRGGNPSAAALSQLHPAQYQLLNLHTPLTMIQTFRFHRWFVRSEPIWASGGGYSFPICGGDSFFNLFPIYANYHMNYLNAELQLNLFHPVKCCSSDVNHNQSLELIPNSCWDSEQHVVCKGARQTWGSVNIPSSSAQPVATPPPSTPHFAAMKLFVYFLINYKRMSNFQYYPMSSWSRRLARGSEFSVQVGVDLINSGESQMLQTSTVGAVADSTV